MTSGGDGIADCQGCNASQYKADAGQSSDTCIACPANSGILSTGSDAESDCLALAGYTGQGSSVTACVAGKYKTSSPSAAACTGCAASKYKADSTQTSDTCIACPANSGVLTTGSDAEDDCLGLAGYSGAGSAISACPLGKYKAVVASAAACMDCEAGKWAADTSAVVQCTECVAGKYKSEAKQFADTCIDCAAKTFKAETGQSSDTCIACGPGQSANAPTAATGCKACVAGAGNGDCVECQPGKYVAEKTSVADALCESCLQGTFQDGIGETECKACPAHSSSQEGSAKLEQCLAGAGYAGSGVSIVPCPAGTFKANVQSPVQCTDCAAGQYSGAEAATECTGCSAGKFLLSEGGKSADNCKACDFGKYSTTIGANSPEVCVACGSDLIPDPLRSGCLACPNFIIPGRGAQPTLCPKGVLDLS